MKRIFLVYPNVMRLPSYFAPAVNISTDIHHTLPPLGMLYIISNSRYDIDFIDNRIRKNDFQTISNILMQYDIIGFGGTIFEIKEARKLSQYLLQEGKTTIYGGPNATVNWNLYLGYFSVIVRGEAELMFDKIIDNINNLENLGFTMIKGTFVNLQTFRIRDLDKLSFPDRSKIDLDEYERTESAFLGSISPVDTVVSTRGCPFNCYFCSSRIIWGQKYTFRSVDNVIKEIEHMIKNYGTKGIYFREDNFTINKKRVIEFCNKVERLSIVWMCESRVDTLDEETIKSMADSGCKGIWFGIESTNNTVLKRIRKKFTLAQVEKAIGLCNKYGITTGGGFMIGFPFEDEESIVNNYLSSKKLDLQVRFYNRVWAIPHSEMYEEILNEGLDYYAFENILLPGTRYLGADDLNKLYYDLISKRVIFAKKIAMILGKNTIEFIRNKLPFFYRLVIKWCRP